MSEDYFEEDLDELSQMELEEAKEMLEGTEKMFQEFSDLIKKGVYKDNQEDFQKFINIEWSLEDKDHRKEQERKRLNGD